ncbi:unnamed protein product [Rotaria sp. Silwood1]|nr:unnamed protein product [Rotaria sp. Silwood1]
MNPSSGNLGLNTVVSTLVQNPSITRSPSTTATIVSNIPNTSSPVNLFSNLSSGIVPPNNTNTSTFSQGQSTSSRLKVEDALSYLDKVKNQFALQPQVYNQFLDIMKEFKSQSIDTQEVINRVSTLFHGHPDLIVGFNTFLPPGYKIEVSHDHPCYIQVTHPSSRTESIAIGNNNSTYNLAITTPTSTTYHSSTIRQTSNLLNEDNEDVQIKNEVQQQLTNPTSQAVNALISAASAPQIPYFGTTGGFSLSTKTNKQQISSNNNNNNNNTTNSNGQPVEFNHAINYVNKIKNRFHQNPNVYKTFLEILHTYQKQQKDAKESPATSLTTSNNGGNNQTTFLSETEVYAKVAQLFTNHEDLLSEFSQFLPDATQQPTERMNCISDILSSSDTSTTSINSIVSNTTPRLIINNTVSSSITTPSTSSSSLTTTSPIPSQTIISSTINKDEICYPSSPKHSTIITSSINTNKRSVSSSKLTGITKKKRITLTNNTPTISSSINDTNIHNNTTEHNKRLPSIDEIAFFDKVQRTLRSPLVFDNFLRCILLYTKRIISRIELFELIQSYLGHVPELLKTFQELINLREPGEVIIPKSIYDQNDTDSMISIDDDDDDAENENNTKRDKKSRPIRYTDTNRRRNLDLSTTKSRQISQEYQKPDDMFHLFFVNDNYYYFFRLHQLLCERLLKMFQQSLRLIEQDNGSQRNRSPSIASVFRLSNRPNISVEEYYSVFLDMIRHLLDGNMDSSSYEDSLREMFGIHAYIAFTMDKIIQNCVRQLHAIVTDESSDAIMRLYSRTSDTVGLVDNLYSIGQQNAEAIYQREMEPYANGNRLFRICSFKNDRRVTTSLILIDSSDDEDEEKICENGTNYVESYLHKNEGDHDETSTAHLRTKLRKKPRFLLRNLTTLNDQSTPEVITINNDYCLIDAKTLKRRPFHRAGFFLYKPCSFRSTRQNHKRITLEQYNRFRKFYQDWSLKHISDNDNNDSINDLWLKAHRFNNNNDQQPLIVQSTISNDDNDLLQPPYHHYQRYHIVDTDK